MGQPLQHSRHPASYAFTRLLDTVKIFTVTIAVLNSVKTLCGSDICGQIHGTLVLLDFKYQSHRT